MPDAAEDFTEQILPCEGCGTDVHFLGSSPWAKAWADDIFSVWCHDCWDQRAAVGVGETPQTQETQ